MMRARGYGPVQTPIILAVIALTTAIAGIYIFKSLATSTQSPAIEIVGYSAQCHGGKYAITLHIMNYGTKPLSHVTVTALDPRTSTPSRIDSTTTDLPTRTVTTVGIQGSSGTICSWRVIINVEVGGKTILSKMLPVTTV